jgi:hypothetical protein
LATNRLDDGFDASPVVVGLQLLLRGQRYLYCLEEAALAGEKATPASREALGRAIDYLAREVPRWSADNGCYSCHNNGDGARALYTAHRLGWHVDPDVLADTTAWLRQPAGWEHNGGEGDFNDPRLATIQFGAALAAAIDAGATHDVTPLAEAAGLIAAWQQPDGAWVVDPQAVVGSPVTYGTALATASARRLLAKTDSDRFAPHVAAADGWLRTHEPKTVLDAAGVLLGLRHATDDAALTQRQTCLEMIAQGQQRSGGWGPFVRAAAEPFDTAVVLLALAETGDAAHREAIARGRAWLLAVQQDDGSWLATTRPAGGQSYAQHMSTTAWATLALLATDARSTADEPPAAAGR